MSANPFDEPVVPPFSPDAEASVVGQMLAHPGDAGAVVATLLEPHHFYLSEYRCLYGEILEAYYSDSPLDPLTIGERCAKVLARVWKVDEPEAVGRVQRLAAARSQGQPVDHAAIVKRDADYRALLDLSGEIQRQVKTERDSPIEVAGLVSQTAMNIATSTLHKQEMVAWDDLGQRFLQEQRLLMTARERGVDIGAYFGLSFLDSFTRGLRGSELFILAGEPGAGKSAVTWKAAQLFAERQMRKPADRRIGTLVLSLEMSEEDSSTRVAQSVSGLDGGKLREGRTSDDDLAKVMREWQLRKGIPMYFNFASIMRAGQMRALIVEAIRRYHVGLVVVDHFRYFDMEGRFSSSIEEDEAKARFLKQDIATQLNVAVICLAHTTKGIESSEDRRPRLSHLRGSGQVAAHADFVGFVYRPYTHAKQADIDDGSVKRTDAELIYAKNRHGLDGTARFFFDPSTMSVY